jgi:hypothetical protein
MPVKKTEITIETHQVWLVRQAKSEAFPDSVQQPLEEHDPYRTRTDGERQIKRLPALPSNATSALCCALCGDATRMIAAERAATMSQASRRLIYRWIEEGSLHFGEMADGAVLVCGRTLAAKLDQLESATQRFAG